MAVQHNLKYVRLDDHINLGNYKFDDFYKQAVVKVTGKKPGQRITKRGKSCTYGITMLVNAQNREAAIAFLEFLFNPEGGLKVLKEMGQPPFIPCRVPTREMYNRLPKELQKFVEAKD